MVRPKKWRKVEFMPENKYFIPLDKRGCELEEIKLKIEELEAMRLKDQEGLSQEECAERMHVSRQTFQNIINEARKKVTQALIEGKAINIHGGNYTLHICNYQCEECGEEFAEPFEKEEHICPSCGSVTVVCLDTGSFCHKKCRKPWCPRE